MKKILVDMDDTLCHFSEARQRALMEEPGIQWPQSQYGFFRNLLPIRGAKAGILHLRCHFEVHVVTRPSIDNPLCWTEKAEWVKEHLGYEMLKNTTMTSHKHLFAADYLIDDTPWPGFTGEQIQFGLPPFSTWAEVVHYILLKEGLIN